MTEMLSGFAVYCTYGLTGQLVTFDESEAYAVS